MWLLNAESRHLELFSDENAVPGGYAILSHRWEDEEVSFQDIRDLDSARRLKGYRKIHLTCQQALRHNLRYAWIDTCCIDKKSSAELSEAINSMFNFYKRSKYCYVFLSDVKTTREKLEPDYHTPSSYREKPFPHWFAQSVWFERGWTLQELIAPEKVEFRARDWTYIGTKSGLASILATITGIDVNALQNRTAFQGYSVAQRMSWAAGRKTTRLEDRAYSLLGLFNVNMALLYGEGDKAFLRLQQEIIKESDDQSIFLWDLETPSRRVTDYKILAPSPDRFSNAGKIISFNKSLSRPYELTNSGLRIALYKTNLDSETYFVFNCRYSDDFRGPIALPIDVHDPHADSQIRGDPPRYALSRRLGVISASQLAGMEPSTCFLVDYDKLMGTTGMGPKPAFSLWIREDKSFSMRFRVEHARPRANWNPDSKVMQWPSLAYDGAAYWGSVSWSEGESFHVTLLFRAYFDEGIPRCTLATICTNRRLSESECVRWEGRTLGAARGVHLHNFGSDPFDPYMPCPFNKQIIASFKGPGRLKISADNQKLFGRRVCVVDISIHVDATEMNEMEVTNTSRLT